MNQSHRMRSTGAVRFVTFSLLAVALFAGTALWGGTEVSANHPVLIEGNCDSPVPGTTLVTIAGTCGDFDGDGRIGTAEDTDGADRIFGTLRAALGPGTGAAAGTGANHNGKILIVASGRFAETLFIGNSGLVPGEGTASPGNLTLEAAPGVEADIDAVLQGDPNNNARQGATGIQVAYTQSPYSVVTLRNLVIRNFSNGITTSLKSLVHIDHCRLEGNLNYGIRVLDGSNVVITHTRVDSTGFRVGAPPGVANPGHGISVEDTSGATAKIAFTHISFSAGAGINNTTTAQQNVLVYGVSTYFNNPNIGGDGVSIAADPNFAQ